jgi:hypothetical protein
MNMSLREFLLVAITLSVAFEAKADQSVGFTASIEALTDAQKAKMNGLSWHEGCPVPLDDLVSIHLKHFGYDGAIHDGMLVVHRRVAKEIAEAFKDLFAARFPIERMRPYEDFAVGEYAANNDTVGFYCRPAQDNPNQFSWHAYGLAVDINPMTNPYHDPKGWWPAGSDGDRDRITPGLLTADSKALRIFMEHGWEWGGWENPPDYMHFGKVTVGEDDNPLKRPVWASRLQFAPN